MNLADQYETVNVPIGIPGSAGVRLTLVEVFNGARGKWAVFDARQYLLGHVVRDADGRWAAVLEGRPVWFVKDRSEALTYIARRTIG